jgi:hypothetical protein
MGDVPVELGDPLTGQPGDPELPVAADAVWKVAWAADGRGVACLRDGPKG